MNGHYREYYVRFRQILIDVTIAAVLITCCVLIRGTVLLVDRLDTQLTAVTSEVVATRSALQILGRDISSNLSKLNVNSLVLIDRLDTQLTRARTQIKDAATSSRQSNDKERQQITDAISNMPQLAPAVVVPKVQVIPVPNPSPEEIRTPDVSAESPTAQLRLSPEATPAPEVDRAEEPKHRRNLWKHIWTKLFRH